MVGSSKPAFSKVRTFCVNFLKRPETRSELALFSNFIGPNVVASIWHERRFPTQTTFFLSSCDGCSKLLQQQTFALPTKAVVNFRLAQCDLIGWFLKAIGGDKYCYKSGPNVLWLDGLFWKSAWTTFGKIWANFYINIWPHWTRHTLFTY